VSQWNPPSWQPARLLALDRDDREEGQQEDRGDACASEIGCSRVSARQLLLLACGFDIALANLLGGGP
jgi:hypothetical protein